GQGVAIDEGALGQAFGAGGADGVLAEFFEHRSADHAGEDGGERSPHGDGGQHEVRERTGAGDREPAQLDGEEENQDGAEREVGERQTKEADYTEQPVGPAVAASGRAHSSGDRKNDGYEKRSQRELQSVGIALGEQARHALLVAERRAEVAVKHAAPVVQILLAEWGIEAVEVA